MSETRSMDEWRRRGYLKAMGVMVWEPRTAASSESEPATEPAVVTPARIRSAVAPTRATPRREAELEGEIDEAPTGPDAPELAGMCTPVEPGMAVARMDWDALDAAVSDCRACRLWETRTRTVFGVGNRNADLMIVGEAPGADEDRVGEPFVGRAGQLLDLMLAAIGCPREQVYIANILKCRPPGNRDPKPDEALRCQDYLIRQMELIRPRLILAVGRIAAQHLLGTDTPLGQLRGRWLDFGQDAIPLRVTYHPAYLLRSPEQKARAWADLTEVRRRLDAVRASAGRE